MLRSPNRDVNAIHFDGVDQLVGGDEEVSPHPAVIMPGTAESGYFRLDKVDVEHVRGRHLDFDAGCTTCTSMTMRGRQQRLLGEEGTAGAGREVCLDPTGRPQMAYNGSESLLVALRRKTRYCFVKALPHKRSDTVNEATADMQSTLRGVWRFHSDEGHEFTVTVGYWLRAHVSPHYNGRLRSNREQFRCRE